MGLISELIVNLKGNTGSLDTALDRSGQKVGSFATKVESSGGSMSSGLGLIGGSFTAVAAAAAAAGAALVAFGLQRQGAIEETKRTADELGLTYNALVGVQHAADQTGVSAETLDTALRKLSIGVSGAAKGGGEAVKALNELHLSASELNGLSADKQLDRIADAMKGVTNQGDRVRLATELFGREGASMVNMLDKGSAGLQKFKDEAQALGLTLSKDQIEAVEKSNAAWKRMHDAMNGIGNTIAVLIAPAVEKVTGVIQWLFQAINTGINAALPYWNEIYKTGQEFFNMLVEMGKPIIETIMSVFNEWSNQLGGFGVTWDNIKHLFLNGLWTMQYEFKHWKDFLMLGWDTLVLGVTVFGNDIVHIFTVWIPGVFQAFGEFAQTFFTNLGKNVTENAQAIWDAIKGGKSPELVWHDLGEGFDKAMKDIEAKAHRPLTEFEKNLAAKIKKEGGDLGAGLLDELNKKWAEFNKEKGKDDDDKAPDRGKSTTSVKNKDVAAVEMGSAEAFKIIAGVQGDKMYSVANEQLKTLREHNKKLDKLLTELGKPHIAVAHLK